MDTNTNSSFEDYINSLSDSEIKEYLAECEADAILSSIDYVFGQDWANLPSVSLSMLFWGFWWCLVSDWNLKALNRKLKNTINNTIKTMQVFRINPTTAYSGGVALVAAWDTDEAIKVFCSTELREYEYDTYECTCNIVVGLDYNTKEPALILDTLIES